jgi:hypothetical protein
MSASTQSSAAMDFKGVASNHLDDLSTMVNSPPLMREYKEEKTLKTFVPITSKNLASQTLLVPLQLQED